MEEKRSFNADALLEEILKNSENSVDAIFEKAKKRIEETTVKIILDTEADEEETAADEAEDKAEDQEEEVTLAEEEAANTEAEEREAAEETEASEEEEEAPAEEAKTERAEIGMEKTQVVHLDEKKIEDATEDEILAELFGDIKDSDGDNRDEESDEGEADDEAGKFSFREMKEKLGSRKKHTETAEKTQVFRNVKADDSITADDKTKINGQFEAGDDEIRIEEELKEQRRSKIEKFRISTEKLTDGIIYEGEEQADTNAADMAKVKKGEDVFAAVEKVKKPKKENAKRNEILKKRNSKVYEKIDVGRVKLELKTAADRNRARLITVGVVTVLSIISEIVKALYVGGKLPAISVAMTDKSFIFYAVSGVLSIPVIAVCADMFVSRLKKSERFGANNEMFLLVLCLCNLFHTVVQIVLGESITGGTMFFILPLSVIALISVLSDKKENEMIMRNLETITRNEKIMGIYSLGRDTDKLAAGISSAKEPNILCASEVEVPDSFMDSSTIKDKQDNFMKFAIICMVIFAAVCAVIAKVTYGTVTALSTSFVSAAFVTSPAILAYMLTTLIANANQGLNRSGCEILGYEAVEYMDNTDAVVLDTSDIFNGEISKFHIINSTSPIDTMEAFRITCAVLSEAEGVLKKEADGFTQEQKLVLPETDGLEYEERLGLSCWVNDVRILLGTRQMMVEHNLEVPPEYIETAYLNEGKKVFYLAYDSKVVAMFCAEYFIGMQAKKQLQQLYQTGIILMLMTTDPHIDEAYVANSIGVDISSIKTVNSAGMDTIKKSIDKTARQKRTGLIFKKNVAGLLRVINTAFRLYDVQSLTMLIQAISIGFAFAISVVLNIVATSIFFSPLMIILYHLLWAGLSLIMTRKK